MQLVVLEPPPKSRETMIAADIENGEVFVREFSKPKGNALIGMTTAGICNTDLELKPGYYGFKGNAGHGFQTSRSGCNQSHPGLSSELSTIDLRETRGAQSAFGPAVRIVCIMRNGSFRRRTDLD